MVGGHLLGMAVGVSSALALFHSVGCLYSPTYPIGLLTWERPSRRAW